MLPILREARLEFGRRQLSPFISRMWTWRVSRSSRAPARRSDPKTWVHSSKGRLVVTRMDPRSQRWLKTSKSSSAPVGDRGTKPSSSTMSRLSRVSCRCRLSRRLSSLASISSWTRAAVNPTDIPRWQAQSQGDVGLAGAAVSDGDDVLSMLDAFAAGQLHDKGLVHRGDGHKVEGVQGLDGGEAGAAARVAMFQLTAVAASASSDGFVRVLPHIFCGPPSRKNRPTLLEALDRQVGDDAEMV